MIVTRTPTRISLGGGGTDIRSYASRYGGFLISAAIDKYVYITVWISKMVEEDRESGKGRALKNQEGPIVRVRDEAGLWRLKDSWLVKDKVCWLLDGGGRWQRVRRKVAVRTKPSGVAIAMLEHTCR